MRSLPLIGLLLVMTLSPAAANAQAGIWAAPAAIDMPIIEEDTDAPGALDAQAEARAAEHQRRVAIKNERRDERRRAATLKSGKPDSEAHSS